MNATHPDWAPPVVPPDRAELAPTRPALARWAAIAGILANLWLLGTFFVNWTWQAQLGSVAPLAIVWFAGWWRWQQQLDRFEVADLQYRIRLEAAAFATHDAAVERARRPGVGAPSEDPAFEACYQRRRALERRAEAEAALARLQAAGGGGWRRRHAANR